MRRLLPVFSFALFLAQVATAWSADTIEILDNYQVAANTNAEKTSEGVLVTSKNGSQCGIHSKEKYPVPLIITAQVKTDSDNIRLFFGDGAIILGSDRNTDVLKYVDPKTREQKDVPKKGQVPANTWMTVRWTVDETSSHLDIDGVERAAFKGDYRGLSGKATVGTAASAKVTVKSFKVTASSKSENKPTLTKSVNSTAADVEVPARLLTDLDKPLQHAPFDASQMERPDFRDHPKSLEKSIATITAMTAVGRELADLSGQTADILAAVSASSRQGTKAGAGFVRAEGDDMMKTSFEEAVRAVSMRYPLWEPGHIDVSFGEKFTGKAGPSAGTAFALLMLSCLEGFDIDPQCAITGDITVDWKVRGVGGIGAKIRGAAADKCLYAAIPASSEAAFMDTGIYYGHHAWWDVQVFSIATLQDAQAIVRQDRSEKLTQAIKLFADLQPRLTQSEHTMLQNPETVATLKKVLDLAPNHLSAKICLALASNKAPRTLSVSGSYYYLRSAVAPFKDWFEDPDSDPALYKNVVASTRKHIDILRPILDKTLVPLLTDESAFLETFDGAVHGRNDMSAARTRYAALQSRVDATFSDASFIEKLMREGY